MIIEPTDWQAILLITVTLHNAVERKQKFRNSKSIERKEFVRISSFMLYSFEQ